MGTTFFGGFLLFVLLLFLLLLALFFSQWSAAFLRRPPEDWVLAEDIIENQRDGDEKGAAEQDYRDEPPAHADDIHIRRG